jgi:putative colanic acid biosynthesis acetyltransferase WcaF
MNAHDAKNPSAERVDVDLRRYDYRGFSVGAGRIRRSLWYVCNALFFGSPWFPAALVKAGLLRLFGARIGARVVIKPRVSIKYPWRLQIGNDVWIGEGVWIDNVGQVTIGDHCCLSQGAYLLTGNHDYTDERFGLMVGTIVMEQGTWVAARSTVCPNVRMHRHSIVTVGSVLTQNTVENGVYSGNPAQLTKMREIRPAQLTALT